MSVQVCTGDNDSFHGRIYNPQDPGLDLSATLGLFYFLFFFFFFLLSFALGVCGLEDAGSRHEVLDVLTQDLVLRLELQVLLLDSIHPCGQIFQGVLKFQNLIYEPGLLLHLNLVLHVSIHVAIHGEDLVVLFGIQGCGSTVRFRYGKKCLFRVGADFLLARETMLFSKGD